MAATIADFVIGKLRSAGVRAIFGVPGGGGNLDLIEAARGQGLPFVLTSTETAGAIAAIAQSEITGRPAACLTTIGPGASSVVNGVACAFLDRAPLIVFTDSHPASANGIFEHQRLDHAALLAPVTKWRGAITPANYAQAMTSALHEALSPRPGPVHLDCPGDLSSAAATMLAGTTTPPRSALSSTEQSRLDTLFSQARKPLLIVGLGARGTEDAAAIRAFCDRCSVPTMVTYKAKGVVPDDHPWFAGVFTNGAIEQAVIDECDLLIGIGLDPVELIPRAWKHKQPIVYFGSWAVEDRHVPFAVQVITDVPDAVQQIEASLDRSSWDGARVRELVAEQRRRISIPADGLTAQRVVEIAAVPLASTSRVTVDAGAHMFPATMLWPVSEPNGMLISNGLSTMGFALPAAIGAALIDRDRPVVALTGDGGLLMCLGELATVVRERLRIIVIVFNDASLSLIEIKQQQRRLTPAGVALGDVNWPALGTSLGLASFSASSAAELERAIDQAAGCSGPALIDAKIDRSNYGATLKAIRG